MQNLVSEPVSFVMVIIGRSSSPFFSSRYKLKRAKQDNPSKSASSYTDLCFDPHNDSPPPLPATQPGRRVPVPLLVQDGKSLYGPPATSSSPTASSSPYGPLLNDTHLPGSASNPSSSFDPLAYNVYMSSMGYHHHHHPYSASNSTFHNSYENCLRQQQQQHPHQQATGQTSAWSTSVWP